VAVHYGGQPADLAELASIARDAGIELIEDAAQAHGASYRDTPVGGFGRAAMFSFTPTKNVTTGEGGIVTTNDTELATQLRLLRNHGQTSLYKHAFLGYNWRISEIQAAMGVVQINKLDAILNRKWANAIYLRHRLADIPNLSPPVSRSDRTHTYMLFTLKVPARLRDRVMGELLEAGIEARLYFPPAHLQPVFSANGVRLPTTERLATEMLSIPFHSRLSRTELDTIADALARAAG
jgi:perosamine synthetase